MTCVVDVEDITSSLNGFAGLRVQYRFEGNMSGFPEELRDGLDGLVCSILKAMGLRPRRFPIFERGTMNRRVSRHVLVCVLTGLVLSTGLARGVSGKSNSLR